MTISCLKSLKDLQTKEILLVNNNSTKDEVNTIQKTIDELNITQAKILDYNYLFNFQKLNNWAAKQCTGKVLWFLNNDVEVPVDSVSLVKEMYEKAVHPEIGAVGCVLLYADKKTIQHAGVYLCPGDYAKHLYQHEELTNVVNNSKFCYNINESTNLSAVTAASLMVEKSKFDVIGGFNTDYIINGGDVDLCLRLERNGHNSLLVGAKHGYMIHKESQSVKHKRVPYSDFANSYASYIQDFDSDVGDKYIDTERLK